MRVPRRHGGERAFGIWLEMVGDTARTRNRDQGIMSRSNLQISNKKVEEAQELFVQPLKLAAGTEP